jgi:hypothetical protein
VIHLRLVVHVVLFEPVKNIGVNGYIYPMSFPRKPPAFLWASISHTAEFGELLIGEFWAIFVKSYWHSRRSSDFF